MKWRGEVNGLKAEAYYPDDFAGACLRMLRRFTAKYRETGKRQILFLAAPPGAGKSTLAAFLADLSRGDAQCEETRALGIDGFHLPRAALEGKSAVRNGITVPLREIRGAPETFDLEALTDALRRLKAGENILWPEYSRVLHDPVPGRLPVREQGAPQACPALGPLLPASCLRAGCELFWLVRFLQKEGVKNMHSKHS